MTTETTAYEQAAIPKFCPVCGRILTKVWDEELDCYCWVCVPDCGYIEPILP